MSLESYLGRLYFNVNHNPLSASVQAYFDAVLLYTGEIIATTNWMMGKAGLMKKVLRREAQRCDRLSLVTFNIDLLLENALQLLAGSRPAIPWCLSHAYGLPSNVKTGAVPGDEFDWTGSASEIALYKMHGSINWLFKHRDRYPPADLVRKARDIYVVRNKTFPDGQMVLSTPKGQRNWYLFPLIVPPVYEKHALIRRHLQQVWDNATKALGEASRVIFWGYSFPAADTHARHFFEGLAQANGALRRPVLINPDPGAARSLWSVLRPTRVEHYRTAEAFLAA
ncbi:MAG: hypothetical protein QOI91_947 [Solirubrobacteraceae bacterium]|nr:hypothetical protein [Solirubrobacteraceae bacterium]